MECLTLPEEAGVGHLVLNRPDAMNTMSPQLWRELEAVLDPADRLGESAELTILDVGDQLPISGRHGEVDRQLELHPTPLAPQRWRPSVSVDATVRPALSKATMTCIAGVDLPEPPFSLPNTMMCPGRGAGAAPAIPPPPSESRRIASITIGTTIGR